MKNRPAKTGRSKFVTRKLGYAILNAKPENGFALFLQLLQTR